MSCMICHDTFEVRHVDLYICGSEGLEICHACEMDFVIHIRAMIGVAGRAKLSMVKAVKEQEKLIKR